MKTLIPLFAAMVTTHLFASNYFVSTSGSDFNTGSISNPFATIQKGIDMASNPGDTIFVFGGTYFEKLNFPHSGSVSSKIVLTSYNNENVIVDGSAIPFSEGIFVSIYKQSHIVIKGITFQNFLNRVQKSVGLAIVGGSEGVEILDNQFKNFTPLDTVWGELKGIAVWSNNNEVVNNYKISGNYFENIVCGQSEVLSQNGYVTNFEIAFNEVFDCSVNPIFQCAGGYHIEFANNIWTDSLGVPKNGLFHHNYIHDNIRGFGPKAIYVDGGENIVVEQNLIVNNAVGVGLHTEEIRAVETDNIVVRNNILIDNFFSISIGNDPEIFPNRPPGAVDSIYIYNNTIHKTWRGIEIERSPVSNLFLYNNIFWLEYGEFNDPVIYSVTDSAVNFITDYNLYFTGDGVQPKFKYQNMDYADLASYQLSGNEGNGLFGDPKFINPTNDLRLLPSSAAIDAGSNAFLPPLDYDGGMRPANAIVDIGAFEFGSVLSVRPKDEQLKIILFPNPTNSVLHIEGGDTVQFVNIYSLEGKLKKTSFQENIIDVGNFRKGIYIVEIKFNSGKNYLGKILKF